MIRVKEISVILGGIAFCIGCSSTTSSIRYNPPQNEYKQNSENSTSVIQDDIEELEGLENDPETEIEYPVSKINEELLSKSKSSEVTSQDMLMMEIINYLDTPYKYGGNDKDGIDCSAFTQNVFQKVYNTKLPRTARDQFKLSEVIKDKSLLEFGDLIFFNTSRRSYPGHVGIYLGDNMFAHASRKLGVTISSLESSYYKKRYIGFIKLSKV